MGFFYNRERGEVYPAHSGKSLRLYEVKAHPLLDGFFFKKVERGEVYPAHSGKSLRLYEVKAHPALDGLFL
jgi:hypothetical protein